MDDSIRWRPTAPLSVLSKRAEIFFRIREFFRERQVMEVDTPILGSSGVTDPHIQNLVTQHQANAKPDHSAIKFLQTSPEYAMKRLLASGSGSIYQLGKVFRDEQTSPYHQCEFTMLEWYRVGWSDEQLLEEVKTLIATILELSSWTHYTYKALFEKCVGVNPHSASITELQRATSGIDHGMSLTTKEQWLDLLFTHRIEPALKKMGGVVVTQYPASQASLAQLCCNEVGEWVARRFEIYIDGLELANGYQELQDANEQLKRFEQDLNVRKELGLPEAKIDQQLLAAMQVGLPACAGVALGVDRLVMLSVSAKHIAEVLPFGEKAHG